jgi:hypothetical protein
MTDLPTLDRPTPAKIVRPRRDAPSKPATVTATQLGEHLGLTRQRIGALADTEHVIERLPNGRFDQNACRLKYLAWLRDPQRRSARPPYASATDFLDRLIDIAEEAAANVKRRRITTSRMITVRLPPPVLPGGISGSTSPHSSSVRSLGYRNLLRS